MSDINLDTTALGELVETLLAQGLPLRHARYFSLGELAGLYQLAYTLYQQAQVERAEILFRFLCLHDHLDPRYWLALGACRQHQEQYAAAVTAYSQAALLAPADPNLPFYAGCCYQALERYQDAERAFRTTQRLAGEQPQYQTVAERAALLIDVMIHRQTSTPPTP